MQMHATGKQGPLRSQLFHSVRRGFLTGLKVLWELAKVMVPAAILVNVLDRAGIMPYISAALGPIMSIFGLPGEAAIALVSANLSTVYAGLGVMGALTLTWKQVTILCAMMAMCHSAISETALVSKAGGRGSVVLVARFVAMLLLGIVLNLVLH